ncbi:hypothetical protein [Streptomyces fulvoviolaceus]|uniref:hypothetical protein n=1 Tax=Streptomyces fulvoviolaceus TaxID=285535 RepID=UPI0021C0AC9F|nr:hypothetical protein [Streptomyces fulvoviolaceus]MCT9080846.1 hypothetical protein [Streptomyces fulvoviolaceus]
MAVGTQAPGSAQLVLARNVVHLDLAAAVFRAMKEGWARQQSARFLNRSVDEITRLMKQHGLPGLSARNTAMLESVADLPPIVISDLFGIAPGTAHKWAQYAQNSWADYLAACQSTEGTKD